MSIIHDIGKSIFGGETSGEKAAREAAEVQTTAAREALGESRRQFDITQEQAEPFRQAELEALQRGAGLREQQTLLGESRTEAAQQALQQQRALTGLAGAEAQQQAMAGLEASPAQQFMRERQQQALLRSSAALGGLGGGQVRSELQQQAAGFAGQDLQNQLARLSAFGGSGMTGQVSPQVAQQLGMQRGQFAGQAGGLMQAAGQAQAGGILGAQQARAGLQGQLLGAGIGAGLGGAGLLGSGVGAGRGALLGLI